MIGEVHADQYFSMYKTGIVGASGAVGQELIQLLLDRKFPASRIRCFTSARSAGKSVQVRGKTWTFEELKPEVFDDLDIAIFSAGSSISREFGPIAAEKGCVVVDNSSAFRQDAHVPLVIPEINRAALHGHKNLIANPNCSTAISLMGLYPLHHAFGLTRFVACTYQAVSGAGAAAMDELDKQVHAWAKGEPVVASVFPHQIAFNLIPQVDQFLEDGYTKEEKKMLWESRKIMGHDTLKVSTTCVRVPVFRAHSIAIHAEFERSVSVEAARAVLKEASGVELFDDPMNREYPMPIHYAGKENCAVGRLRVDSLFDNGLAFWIVGDQLWKGAALNAVQIAAAFIEDGLISVR